jgi:hypothetical protein
VSSPRPLGTVNGFCPDTFVLHGRTYHYPGTTLSLTLAALEAGARVGDSLTTGLGYSYVLSATGGGDRTPDGRWARRTF